MATPVAATVEIFPDTKGAKIIEDDNPEQRDSRDIYLPNHIEAVSHIAVDIGGSLAKVVYFTRARSSSETQRPQGDASSSSARGGPSASRPSSTYAYDAGYPVPSGTLTPTAILSSSPPASLPSMSSIHSKLLRRRSLPSALPGGRLNFIKFETGDIESCINFLRELIESSARTNGVSVEEMRKGVKVMATGGGAHMFYETFERELGVEVRREDEMGCLITGLNFITLIPDEVFWYSDELVSALHEPLPPADREGEPRRHSGSSLSATDSGSAPASPAPDAAVDPSQLPRPSPNPPLYTPVFDSQPTPRLPCLLVNIGSGVSIIKVDDYGRFERVTGTSLGGGTLWGLLSLLTDADSFDEMLEMSERGDNSTVDMLVGDIYGSVGYNAMGLKSSTIASSFGKVFRKDGSEKKGAEGRKRKFKPEDICKSLLYAISNNIGQIAYMNAEKYNLDRIYFGGCFIRGHRSTISTLSYAIRFWSRGSKRAFFLRHEGYLGAIGAWLRHVGAETGFHSRRESGSSEDGRPSETSDPLVPQVNGINAKDSADLEGSAGPNGHDTAARPLERTSSYDPNAAAATMHSLPGLLQDALGGATLDGYGVSRSRTSEKEIEGEGDGTPVARLVNGHGSAGNRSADTDTSAASQIHATRTADSTEVLDPSALEDLSEEDLDSMTSLSALLESVSPADRAIIASMLESKETGAPGEGEGGDELSVRELLGKLEAAEGAADGLEGKLDSLLERLDGMLESAEHGTVDGR